MKNLLELKNDVKSNEELKSRFMDMAQFIFSKSQENLVRKMPWGDNKYHNTKGKKDTVITDTSDLLISGVPPYWENDTRIVFRYDAPQSEWVEYGTPPHMPPVDPLIKWAKRKLRKKGKDAVRMAWAIAYKIKREGMLPHPFIRPAVDSARQKYKFAIISVS